MTVRYFGPYQYVALNVVLLSQFDHQAALETNLVQRIQSVSTLLYQMVVGGMFGTLCPPIKSNDKKLRYTRSLLPSKETNRDRPLQLKAKVLPEPCLKFENRNATYRMDHEI